MLHGTRITIPHCAPRRKRVESMQGVGIAGMRDPAAVKCLHCHYAHYLARPQDGNVIGQWTDELLLKEEQEREEQMGEQGEKEEQEN